MPSAQLGRFDVCKFQVKAKKKSPGTLPEAGGGNLSANYPTTRLCCFRLPILSTPNNVQRNHILDELVELDVSELFRDSVQIRFVSIRLNT